MTLAAYAANPGFAVRGGFTRFLLLRDPAKRVPIAGPLRDRAESWGRRPAAVLQPISGRTSPPAHIAAQQPVKLAAAEARVPHAGPARRSHSGAGPTVAGAARPGSGSTSRTRLSLLAFHDPHAIVKGLDLVPESDWPNVPAVQPLLPG